MVQIQDAMVKTHAIMMQCFVVWYCHARTLMYIRRQVAVDICDSLSECPHLSIIRLRKCISTKTHTANTRSEILVMHTRDIYIYIYILIMMKLDKGV